MAQYSKGDPSLDAARIAMWQKFGPGGGPSDPNAIPGSSVGNGIASQNISNVPNPFSIVKPTIPTGGAANPNTAPTGGFQFPSGGYGNQASPSMPGSSNPGGAPSQPANPYIGQAHQSPMLSGQPHLQTNGMQGVDLTALLQQWLKQRMQGTPSNSPYTQYLDSSPFTKLY